MKTPKIHPKECLFCFGNLRSKKGGEKVIKLPLAQNRLSFITNANFSASPCHSKKNLKYSRHWPLDQSRFQLNSMIK